MLNLEVIEPIINYRKVKYAIMDDLIRTSKIEGSRLNLFINLDTILGRFYDPSVFSAFKSLQGKELIQITAEIFNLIAHYRNYFWTRYKVPTTFYIYNLNKEVKQTKKINPEYLSSLLERKDIDHPTYGIVNYIFNENMSLIGSISKYIKHTYFIESNGLEPSLIPYYFINSIKDKDVCNIIISSDKIDYGLVNLKNTFILKAAGKYSKLISQDDIYGYKFKGIKYSPSIYISPKLYSLIMAMTGCKDRGIKTVCGFTKACKLIEKGISDKVLVNDYNFDIRAFAADYFNETEYLLLMNNYMCLDIERHFRLLREVDTIKLSNSIIDRFDNNALIHLNAKHFETNNIQLIELCKGVD